MGTRGPGGETAQGFQLPAAGAGDVAVAKVKEGVPCGEERELFQALTPPGLIGHIILTLRHW